MNRVVDVRRAALAALKRSSARAALLAGRCPCASSALARARSARPARFRPRPAGRRQRGGALRPPRSRRQRGALLWRILAARPPAPARSLVGLSMRRPDLRLRRQRCACGSAPVCRSVAIACQPAARQLGLARQRLLLRRAPRRVRALALDVARDRGEPVLDSGGRRQCGRARSASPRATAASSRSPVRRVLRLGQRRQAASLRLISRFGLGARRAPRAASLRRAPAVARRGSAAARLSFGLGGRRGRLLPRSTRCAGARARPRGRRGGSSGQARCAAPVGASAAATKPSQRQTSPSRRHQPLAGLEQRQQAQRRLSRCDDADLRQPARQLGRRLDMLAERLDAVRQRRIARIDRRAAPSASARGGRRGASRSSPSAAPSAASKPWSTVSCVEQRRPQVLGVDVRAAWPASCASVSRRCAAAPASASGPRAASAAWRAAECAASARSAAASASATSACGCLGRGASVGSSAASRALRSARARSRSTRRFRLPGGRSGRRARGRPVPARWRSRG